VVFVSGPPGTGGAGGADEQPLYLAVAGRRVFTGGCAAPSDPGRRDFLADLVRPYGVPLQEDTRASGGGQSYAEMAATLIAGTVPDSQPVDLLLLSHLVPDVYPDRATASYLSHRCPGEPVAFALTDQGTAGTFTGLRLAQEYLREGSCQRVLLLVAEQAALGHHAAGPVSLPERHAAVLLMLSGAGPARLTEVRQHPGVTPAQAPGLLRAELAELAGAGPVTLVLGGELARLPVAGLPAPVYVRAAPAGQPGTGVWWELAGSLAGWVAARRRAVLADYDPGLGYLCLAMAAPAR
jgi:4-hydroxymandelate oxidase